MVRMIPVLMALILLLSVPAAAAEVTENESLEVSDPTVAETAASETGLDEDSTAVLSDGASLSGGYYFVCDCDLGYDLKFYVPVEWAHDAFALDASGDLINMSNSTCYAYCPEFPEYSVYCSRFSNFIYRSNNLTYDLNITEISDTNLDLLQDESYHLSDSDMLVLIAGLIFFFGAGFMVLRRR